MKTFWNTLSTLLATVICGIPLWIYLAANLLLEPTGFWQNLALGIVGLWVLGGLQLFLGIAWLVALVMIWSNSRLV